MDKKNGLPSWYENLPSFEGKKKPVKITKEMEVVATYGVDGHDLISYFFVCTEDVSLSAYITPPGHHLIPGGVHCCDEVYYVVKGEATIRNGETGNTFKVKKGSAIVIPKGTLHEVYNFCEESLYVICFIHKTWSEEELIKLEKMVAAENK